MAAALVRAVARLPLALIVDQLLRSLQQRLARSGLGQPDIVEVACGQLGFGNAARSG